MIVCISVNLNLGPIRTHNITGERCIQKYVALFAHNHLTPIAHEVLSSHYKSAQYSSKVQVTDPFSPQQPPYQLVPRPPFIACIKFFSWNSNTQVIFRDSYE